jgi:hypothetical protein
MALKISHQDYDETFEATFGEICDVVERTYQGWPLEHDYDNPYNHTSTEARAAAMRVFELLFDPELVQPWDGNELQDKVKK